MKPSKTFDSERAHFNLARLKRAGEVYEIVVDPDKAVALKEGESLDTKDVLKVQAIFFDAKKGEHASEERMQLVFGTNDPLVIAEIILKEGEIQLTAEHRAKVREAKRKQLIVLISRHTCDSSTKLPHPPQRIENAMVEAKVKIDEFKKAENQLADIIKELRPFLPLSIEERTMSVHIPAAYGAKLYGTVQGIANIKTTDWQQDGSVELMVTLPAGMVSEFIETLNNHSHGGVTTHIIK